MDRKAWDQLVSTAAVVLAVTLIVLGGLAIYGGHFGQQNVRDRLTPEKVTFPPYAAMTPAEQQEVGTFAGQQVTDGAQAEAFSRYIEGHLQGINGGKTYSETSNAARAEGLDPQVAAELQGKADTLFKGETLRAIPSERIRMVDRRNDRPVRRLHAVGRRDIAGYLRFPRIPSRKACRRPGCEVDGSS